MLQRETVRFRIADKQPNPLEVDYWIDLSSNRFGGVIRYFDNNANSWKPLQGSGGSIDDEEIKDLEQQIKNLNQLLSTSLQTINADLAQEIELRAQGDANLQNQITSLQQVVNDIKDNPVTFELTWQYL